MFQVRLFLTLLLATSFLMARTPKSPKSLHSPCKTCVLSGPCCVTPGTAGIFTLSGGTTAGWTTSCGTIIHSTSTLVEIAFPSSGCSVASVETAGATCGGAAATVYIDASCPNIPPCEP